MTIAVEFVPFPVSQSLDLCSSVNHKRNHMRKTSPSLQRVLQSPTKHKTLKQTDLHLVSIKGDIWSLELIFWFCQQLMHIDKYLLNINWMTHLCVKDRGFMSVHLYYDFGWKVLLPERKTNIQIDRQKGRYENTIVKTVINDRLLTLIYSKISNNNNKNKQTKKGYMLSYGKQ